MQALLDLALLNAGPTNEQSAGSRGGIGRQVLRDACGDRGAAVIAMTPKSKRAERATHGGRRIFTTSKLLPLLQTSDGRKLMSTSASDIQEGSSFYFNKVFEGKALR